MTSADLDRWLDSIELRAAKALMYEGLLGDASELLSEDLPKLVAMVRRQRDD